MMARRTPMTARQRPAASSGFDPEPGSEGSQFLAGAWLGVRDRPDGIADHRMVPGLLGSHTPGTAQRAQGTVPVAVIQPAPGELDLVVTSPHRRQAAEIPGPLYLLGPAHGQGPVRNLDSGRHLVRADARGAELHPVVVGAIADHPRDVTGLRQVSIGILPAPRPGRQDR